METFRNFTWLTMILGLWLNISPCALGTPLIWDGRSTSVDLRPALDFLTLPPSIDLSAAEIMDPARAMDFKPLLERGPGGFGYSRSTFWFRMDVQNASGSFQDLLVGSGRAEHTNLDVYVQRGELPPEVYHLGSAVPYSERMRPSRVHFAPLKIAAGESVRVYFSLNSQQSISLQFYLMTDRAAIESERIEDSAMFFYVGAMMFMIFYCLFLGSSLRQPAYFLYSMFGGAIVLTTVVYSGWFEVFNIQLGTIRGSADTPKILLIPFLCSAIYCHVFFRLGEIAPRLARFNLGVIACIGLFALLNLGSWGADFRILITLGQMLNFSTIFGMIYVGLRSRVSGSSVQAFGWVNLFAMSIIWTLGNEGYLEKNFWVAYSILFGNIFEMFMGAIALGMYVKDLEQKKFDAQIKEQESSNLRTLVYVVCHDIANPLSIVSGMASLIKPMLAGMDKPLRFLSKIEHAADMMTAIIEQVRRLEQVRSGKYEMTLEAVDLRDLLEEINFSFQDRAASKGVKLQLNIDEIPPDLAVEADRTSLLNDVLANFISNALKFSDEGQTISVKITFNDRWVTIKVIDQGIGMPPDLIEKLFRAGAMTSRRGTHNEVGTGFGMPLAKYFIDHYGGTIEIHSVEKRESAAAGDPKGDGSPRLHGTTVSTLLKRSFRPAKTDQAA